MNLDNPYTSKYVTWMERLFGVKCPKCDRKMKRVEIYPFIPVWKCLGCGYIVFHKSKK